MSKKSKRAAATSTENNINADFVPSDVERTESLKELFEERVAPEDSDEDSDTREASPALPDSVDDLPSVLHVDFDKTITETYNGENYGIENLEPDEEMISSLRGVTESGRTIIVWTARPYSQAEFVAGWLTMHGCPFEGLKMNKGGGGKYVDDNSIRPEEFKEIVNNE